MTLLEIMGRCAVRAQMDGTSETIYGVNAVSQTDAGCWVKRWNRSKNERIAEIDSQIKFMCVHLICEIMRPSSEW